MRILTLYRAREFSPNNVQTDAAILDAVAERLRPLSSQLDQCSEEQLPASLESYDLILHMARRASSLHRLSQLSHPKVLNQAEAVVGVVGSRNFTLDALARCGISVPNWVKLEAEDLDEALPHPRLSACCPGWVKAMRPRGAKPGDVTFVQSPAEAIALSRQLMREPLSDLILTRHLEGDLLKCYYVDSPQPFLRWFYPQERGYSKFGEAEQHNSPLSRIPFAEGQLYRLAAGVVKALGLQVFGFDTIVQPAPLEQGQPTLSVIDVNDWPTFSICRSEAAGAIANLALATLGNDK